MYIFYSASYLGTHNKDLIFLSRIRLDRYMLDLGPLQPEESANTPVKLQMFGRKHSKE